jgi:hypothetical protein
MRLYRRLWPPPLCQTLILPEDVRPPVFRSPSTSGLNGFPFQRPLDEIVMRPRCPGEVGFHVLSTAVLASVGQATFEELLK